MNLFYAGSNGRSDWLTGHCQLVKRKQSIVPAECDATITLVWSSIKLKSLQSLVQHESHIVCFRKETQHEVFRYFTLFSCRTLSTPFAFKAPDGCQDMSGLKTKTRQQKNWVNVAW
ncbi:hypothetical protein CEXT_445221 [Caerostris extrusa]|uniref:Uncharacterized protein n=1 Tax=Caerostris extrusa TaxID=172846 RepID=A0AAV4XGD5_CAEEX|nr:hypothetical protein CEXT_445221 [Caerostris extrusa]